MKPHPKPAAAARAAALILLSSPHLALALEATAAAGSDSRVATAELALAAGNCRAASEAYAKAASRYSDLRLVRRATEVAVACDQVPAAWTASQRWYALDPENVEALRAAGLVALERYRIDTAREIFGSLLAKPDVEPDRALGELLPLLAAGDQAHAAWAALGAVVKPDALASTTQLELAELAVAADDLSAARLRVEAALRAEPGSARGLRQLARLRAADGDAAGALQAARDAAAAEADESQAAFTVAEVLIDLDRNEEAHAELLRLVEQPQTAEEADRRLALLALATGDFDEARRRFAGRLQRSAGSAEAFFYLGVIAERTGRDDLALQSFQRLASAGAGLMPRVRAARLLVEAGQRDEALAIIDDFLKQDPQAAIEVAIARAEVLLAADAGREAVSELDQALKRYPEHPQLQYQRAMVLERSGRHREAIRAFERYLKERPGDPTALNALGYTLADHGRELPRAEQLVRQALQAMPDNAPAIDSLAWILYRRGDARAALPLLERAYRLSRDSEIAAHWGEVLWALGSRSEARTVWARALARTPDSKPLRAVIARFTGSEADSAPAAEPGDSASP